MALIQCPECGKTISDSIKSCIHCGVGISKCPECGKVVKAGEKVCPVCGKSMEAEKESTRTSSSVRQSVETFIDHSKTQKTSKGYIDATFSEWKKKKNLPEILFGALIPGILLGVGLFFLLMTLISFINYTKTVKLNLSDAELLVELTRLPKEISSVCVWLAFAFAVFAIMKAFSSFRVSLIGVFFSMTLETRQKQDSNYLCTFGKKLKDYVENPIYQKDNDTINGLSIAHWLEKNSEKKLSLVITLFMFLAAECVAMIFTSIYAFKVIKYLIQFAVGRGITNGYKFKLGESSLIWFIIIAAIYWIIKLCKRYFVSNAANQCLQSVK